MKSFRSLFVITSLALASLGSAFAQTADKTASTKAAPAYAPPADTMKATPTIAWVDLTSKDQFPTLLIKGDVTGIPAIEKTAINVIACAAGKGEQIAVDMFKAKGYQPADEHEIAAFNKQFATDLKMRMEIGGRIIQSPDTLTVVFVKHVAAAKVAMTDPGK